MLNIYRNTLLFVAAALLAGGCASSRNAGRAQVSAAPSPYAVMPDASGHVTVDVDLEIPDHYFSRRSRLVILPAVMKDSTLVAEMAPVAVDAPIYAKKLHRKEVLEDYDDTHKGQKRTLKRLSDTVLIHYRDSAYLGESADGSRIVAFVTSDGCGSCRALDTLHLGGISDPGNLLSPDSLRLVTLEPVFVVRQKVREGKGEAELQFRINRSDINLSLGRNREEMSRMFEALQPVISDTLATLNMVSIYGMASADGSLAFNTRLAEARAGSARDWLLSELDGLTYAQRKCFRIGSRPEGWAPVLKAMTLAGDKDSVLVKDILEKYAGSNDDVQERYIRRLPCWPVIRDNYLQKDRKVEYVYTYSIRSFTTDEEMLEMFSTRPDAFNEEEFLRVSTLKEEPVEKMEVYRTLLDYYPQSQVAVNNLSVMMYEREGAVSAWDLIYSLDEYSHEALNTKAVITAAAGQVPHAISLLEDCTDLSEARYNLGLLKAIGKDYEGAYPLLQPFADVNAAIVAVCLGKYDEAGQILSSLDDVSPLAEYVRAFVAAWNGDADTFFTHLEAAVSDNSLRDRAASEAMFDIFRDDVRFDVIMEKR